MTKDLSYIEKQYREYIKEMPVDEFKIYQTMLILNLYDSFIEHDERKALKSKEQIEELTDIYKEKYSNVLADEIGRRLRIANSKLIEQLEENKALTMNFLDLIHEGNIDTIRLSNQILKALLSFNQSNEGKGSKDLIKDILKLMEDRIQFISYYINLLKEEDFVSEDHEVYYLIPELFKVHDEFQELREQIKQL